MIISAHQPAYFPWLGYFEKIASADIFIYLDNVQFEKNSYINRNRIKTPQGPKWLTIPIRSKGHIENSILQTYIDERSSWREKHIKSIKMNYSRATKYKFSFSKIEKIVMNKESNLAEYCYQQLIFWMSELKIKTKIYRLSEIPIYSRKSELIFDLCKYYNAKYYLSGELGKNYLKEDDFIKAGLTINYQKFTPKAYPQLWGKFVPYLSILDWWLNSDDNKLPII